MPPAPPVTITVPFSVIVTSIKGDVLNSKGPVSFVKLAEADGSG